MLHARRSTRSAALRLMIVITLVLLAVGSNSEARPSLSVGRVLKVGYLGCSQTTGAVQGYHELGGARLWATIQYGGGAVNRWSSPTSPYWSTFDQAYRSHPALSIWWQICILTGSVTNNMSQARLVLAQLRAHAPGSLIYVSAQNGYVAPHVCGIGPPNAAIIAEAVSDRLIAGGVLRGPHMSPLRGQDSAGPGATEVDPGGCHPNALGRKKLGANLRAFFG